MLREEGSGGQKAEERDDDDDEEEDTDMGIATPPLPPVFSQSKVHNPIPISHKSNSGNSMSQDYHQGIFSFSNGFERSAVAHQEQQHQQQQHQQHIAQQIRRDKLRGVQGFEPPPPLVAIEEEESGGIPVYETGGMLSEMFNFGPGATTATELLEHQLPSSNYRNPRGATAVVSNSEWYGSRGGMVGGLGPLGDSKNQNVNNRDSLAQHHHQISSINADSAAAMQLFLMNPQTRSPSPPPHPHPPPTSSTLHMLLPNQSTSLQAFATATASASAPGGGAFGGASVIPQSQFTWVPDSGHESGNNPTEIGGIVEGQGLSLSLSSSLQHLEAAKAEELRMGESGMLFYGQGGAGGGGSSSAQYPYKSLGGGHQQPLHLQGGVGHNHQVHVGFGSSLGAVNVMRNSKYVKAAQELLEEFCSVGRGQFKKNKFGRQNTNPNPNSGAGASSSSSKDLHPLSAADRIEHQRRKVKLLSMLDEVCKLSPSLLLSSPCPSIRSQDPDLFNLFSFPLERKKEETHQFIPLIVFKITETRNINEIPAKLP